MQHLLRPTPLRSCKEALTMRLLDKYLLIRIAKLEKANERLSKENTALLERLYNLNEALNAAHDLLKVYERSDRK
jgi:cell division protein FtsB